MRIDILKLLADREGYISGEDISRELNISRAAVWKNMKALKEDGGVVEAQTNKGYRLVSLPDLLKPEYICRYTKKDEEKIKWLDEVDSTNNYAKQLARLGESAGAVVIAERQMGGKGRLGRNWQSEHGDSIMMSFLLRPNILPRKAPAFNIAAALGVVSGIEAACGVKAGIKWPNDVMYQGKKLCGILTEMSSDMETVEFVVCGVGTNVNQQSFAEDIAHRATSLRMITGEKIDRVRLCAMLIDKLDEYFMKFIENGIEALMQEYCQKSVTLGQNITILQADKEFEGVCAGFNSDGELVVECDGKERVFHAGEVSVRGENSYV